MSREFLLFLQAACFTPLNNAVPKFWGWSGQKTFVKFSDPKQNQPSTTIPKNQQPSKTITQSSNKTRWWFQIFLEFSPLPGEKNPNLTFAYFSKGVETQPPTFKNDDPTFAECHFCPQILWAAPASWMLLRRLPATLWSLESVPERDESLPRDAGAFGNAPGDLFGFTFRRCNEVFEYVQQHL